MKSILRLIIFLTSIQGLYAQEQPLKMIVIDGTAKFQKVIDVPGKSSSELYKSAVRWVSVAFKDPESVTMSQIVDDLITGKGSGDVKFMGVSTWYKYAFRIEVKDEKARITMDSYIVGLTPPTEIESVAYKSDGSERTNPQAQGIIKSVTSDANALILSLEMHLTGKGKKDDW